jgi:hypothetical protein
MLIICQSCTAQLTAPEDTAGQRYRCPRCGTVQVAHSAVEAAQVPLQERQPADPSGPRFSQARLALAGLWGVFGLAAILVFGVHVLRFNDRSETSAIRQAAGATDACVWLVSGYVLARAIDKAARLLFLAKDQ